MHQSIIVEVNVRIQLEISIVLNGRTTTANLCIQRQWSNVESIGRGVKQEVTASKTRGNCKCVLLTPLACFYRSGEGVSFSLMFLIELNAFQLASLTLGVHAPHTHTALSYSFLLSRAYLGVFSYLSIIENIFSRVEAEVFSKSRGWSVTLVFQSFLKIIPQF